MVREQLVEIAKRNLAHHRAGTQDQAPSIYEVPATNYYDPDRWAREMDAVFRRLPLVLGFSVELPDPGCYKAIEAVGVPVLLTRDTDGAARAFVNMCSHRGAVIMEEGVGATRRFTCPYHAWSYDLAGDLVGILDRADFGDIDTSCNGLTPLPVAERAGIIFATVTPGAGLDIDDHLQGYDGLLELLHLDETTPVGRQTIEGPNWKVAYDGYLDLYHLPVLHKNSFGSDFPNKACYDAWGPHQNVSSPGPRAEPYEDRPPEEWPDSALHGGVVTIFPHVSVASFDAGGKIYMVSQLFPGADADTSITVQNFLAVGEVDDERRKAITDIMAFLEHVVRDEDYYTGNRIQRAAKTGAKANFLFGRNEGGGQRFHRFVDALLETPDDGLADLFARGVDPT
jgi:phenylpropionate dioxygenase-like ring-hydroxylating dioxygenase large terminal subunit